ncbi:MAG: glycosyltransferase [Candidatus Omnitrophota bacterium]
MNILHVTPTYIPAYVQGGSVRAAHELCKALARRGVNITVYTTNIDCGDISDIHEKTEREADGLKITYFPVRFPGRYYYSPAMSAAIEINAGRFDIVHIHSVFLHPTCAAARVCRRKKVPYILNPFGALDPDMIGMKNTVLKKAYIYFFEKKNVHNAAAIHVASQYEKGQFLKLGFKNRVVVIPPGLDFEACGFGAGAADRAARADGNKAGIKVLFLGRIHPKKGLEVLIRALGKVRSVRKDVVMTVSGTGDNEYLLRIKKAVRDAGLEKHVRFTGMAIGPDKEKIFMDSDIFALPSRGENFGIAILEAMAYGLPVVTTDRVGLGRDVEECNAGIVTEYDADKFARAILGLCDNAGLRGAMGKRGRALARERFDINRIADETKRVYSSIINNNQG